MRVSSLVAVDFEVAKCVDTTLAVEDRRWIIRVTTRDDQLP